MYNKHTNRARENLNLNISLKDIEKAKKKEMAKKMSRIIPGVTAGHAKTVMNSIKKTGRYESEASKKAQKISDKKWNSYIKERSERYKRDGITE